MTQPHLTDGELRAALDNELAEAARAHLATCADCATRRAALEAQARRVTAHLAGIAPPPGDPRLTARPALTRFNLYRSRKETPMFMKFFRKQTRLVVGLGVLVSVLALALGFPGVRAFAGEFLGLFRVQQVTILPIDTTRLSELSGNEALGQQISQLMSDSVKVTKESGEPQTVAGAAEASQLAGFTVRVADNGQTPVVTVQDGTAFEFTINRERGQSILDAAGHPELQLPAALDGAKISVNVPAAVTLAYGNCPTDGAPETEGSPGHRFINCQLLVEMPSPTVDAPPDLDIQQLAEIGLQFTGMTATEAREFSQTVDWTSTLVIPIPRNAAVYEQVAVDGVTGTLIRRPVDDAPQYALVWVKDGIIYAISGLGDGWQGALAMANGLQ